MIAPIDPRVLWVMGVVLALLIVASAAVRLRRGAQGGGELGDRIRSWWIMASIFLVAVLVGPTVSLVFLALVSFLALKEYFSLIEVRRADRRVLFWAYLAIPIQYLFVGYGLYGFFVIFIPVYMFLLIPMRMVSIGQTDRFLRAVGTIQWGLMVTVFSLSHAAFLLVLPSSDVVGVDQSLAPGADGAAMLLCLVALTQLNDVWQFIWGKAFGRRKIVPTVSPGKTWEGFIGGVLTTVAIGTPVCMWLTPLGLWHSAIASLLIGLAGFFGDITVSAVKRDLGIKDTGRLIPGHGGVLDRIDSLTYTAPVFFHFIKFFAFSGG